MIAARQLHLGIIPDGNRRWAKKRALRPWQGHAAGVEAFKSIFDWAHTEPRLAVLTIWGFSTENWNRSKVEIYELMKIYESWLRDEQAELHKKRTRLVHSGRTNRIPRSLAELVRQVTYETSAYRDFTLQLALDYGGRDEIIRAVQKIKRNAALTNESFRSYLDHPDIPDIDLVIRTSGEQRTSGFFIWQAAYAELIFIDKYFPDITPGDLAIALDEFASRQRRFGA